jgi:hypothetical protein
VLTPVDLPAPIEMRGRWAAFAAVCAARGWADGCHATGSMWHFDDGGGNWADLHHLGGGRAVFVGHDHEYSETYHGAAAEYFGEQETNLLAGAPEWWAPPAERSMATQTWIGFVYGFDGARWSRVPYDPNDGFRNIGLPALDDTACHQLITDFVQDAPGRSAPPTPNAIDGLIAADGQLDEARLRAVIGPGWDAAAGVAAARAFRAV